MGRKPEPKSRVRQADKLAEWAAIIGPLMLREGLRNMPVSRIAKEVSVSKATLYKQVSSREELVAMVLQEKIAAISTFAPILLDHQQSYEQRFDRAVLAAAQQLADISPIFLTDLHELYPNLWQQVNELHQFAYDSLEAFYEEGIKAGILQAFSASLMALADRAFIAAISDPAQLSKQKLSLPEALAQYFYMKKQAIFGT
ncbi:MAG: TetR/AcrR family transcriptional regulator [Bacteroidota bacterium]